MKITKPQHYVVQYTEHIPESGPMRMNFLTICKNVRSLLSLLTHNAYPISDLHIDKQKESVK
jgi:hypothetical protein